MELVVSELLADFAPETDSGDITVDISPFLQGEGKSREIKWARPSVPALYEVGIDAAKVRDALSGASVELCVEIALMAHAHISANGPTKAGDTPIIAFYASVAASQNHTRLWMYLSRTLRDWIPDVWAFINGVGDLKKILFNSSVSASSTPEGTPES